MLKFSSAAIADIPAVDGVKYLEVEQAVDPASDEAAEQVKAVRAAVHPVPNADALVGGTAAIFLDTATASHRDVRSSTPALTRGCSHTVGP